MFLIFLFINFNIKNFFKSQKDSSKKHAYAHFLKLSSILIFFILFSHFWSLKITTLPFIKVYLSIVELFFLLVEVQCVCVCVCVYSCNGFSYFHFSFCSFSFVFFFIIIKILIFDNTFSKKAIILFLFFTLALFIFNNLFLLLFHCQYLMSYTYHFNNFFSIRILLFLHHFRQ